MTRRSAGERKGLTALVALILITVLVIVILKSGTSAPSASADGLGVSDTIIPMVTTDSLAGDTMSVAKPEKSGKKKKAVRRRSQPSYRNPLDETL